MKTTALAAALAALSAVGCESYGDEHGHEHGTDAAGNPAPPVREDRLTKLEIDLANHKQGQVYTYEQLVNANKGLVERTTKLELRASGLETTVTHLEEQIKTLSAQLAAAGTRPAPAGTDPGPAPATGKKIEDIQREIEETLSQLQSAKISRDDAATLLRPYGRHAAPRLLDEIAKSVTRFDYVKQLEYILSKLAVTDLTLSLKDAFTRPGVRDSAVRVVGLTKSLELSRILEEAAASPDEDFRLLAGEALVLCRNAAGIAPLVESLKSEQGATRTIAISALKRVNRNEDFGYRAQLPVAANAPSIKSWEQWAATFGKTVFE
jgi:hypothetical protein